MAEEDPVAMLPAWEFREASYRRLSRRVDGLRRRCRTNGWLFVNLQQKSFPWGFDCYWLQRPWHLRRPYASAQWVRVWIMITMTGTRLWRWQLDGSSFILWLEVVMTRRGKGAKTKITIMIMTMTIFLLLYYLDVHSPHTPHRIAIVSSQNKKSHHHVAQHAGSDDAF